VAILFSPAGPDKLLGRVLSLVDTLGALVFAVVWLARRGRWPKRWQSHLFHLRFGARHRCVGSGPVPPCQRTCGYHAPRRARRLLRADPHRAILPSSDDRSGAPVVGLLAVRLSSRGDPVWAWCLVVSTTLVSLSVAILCYTLVQAAGARSGARSATAMPRPTEARDTTEIATSYAATTSYTPLLTRTLAWPTPSYSPMSAKRPRPRFGCALTHGR
jgi:hypothetical protein